MCSLSYKRNPHLASGSCRFTKAEHARAEPGWGAFSASSGEGWDKGMGQVSSQESTEVEELGELIISFSKACTKMRQRTISST